MPVLMAANGLDKGTDEHYILIYDMEDASSEVKATAGDTHLDEDCDNCIVDFCLQDLALAVPAMAATAKHFC